MTKTTLSKLALAIAVVLITTPGAQAAVVNGGFETNGGEGTIPTGWTEITNSYGAHSSFAAAEGTWFLHAGSGFDDGGSYQDVTTVVGTTYELTFDAVGFSAGLAIQEGLVQVGTPGAVATDLAQNNNAELVDAQILAPLFTDVTDWTEFSHTFVANSTTTRISFQNVGLGAGNSAINIDNVVLSVVPSTTIPTPAALPSGMALLGLAMIRRRRA